MFLKKVKLFFFQPGDSKMSVFMTGFTMFALLVHILVVIISYKHLPPLIPSHYSLNGKPDAYGDKSAVWSLPVISLTIFTCLSVLMRTVGAARFMLSALRAICVLVLLIVTAVIIIHA